MEFRNSFEALRQSFAPVVATLSITTFRLRMAGWIRSTRHRYATDLIVSSDAGDDTLRRKRRRGIFGTGMHHDALSTSKSKNVCHWGHEWVDMCIVIAQPLWVPSNVFLLPICMRLYRNRQKLTKGQTKKQASNKRAEVGRIEEYDADRRE